MSIEIHRSVCFKKQINCKLNMQCMLNVQYSTWLFLIVNKNIILNEQN